jgi:hypothetical protein
VGCLLSSINLPRLHPSFQPECEFTSLSRLIAALVSGFHTIGRWMHFDAVEGCKEARVMQAFSGVGHWRGGDRACQSQNQRSPDNQKTSPRRLGHLVCVGLEDVDKSTDFGPLHNSLSMTICERFINSVINHPCCQVTPLTKSRSSSAWPALGLQFPKARDRCTNVRQAATGFAMSRSPPLGSFRSLVSWDTAS